MRARKPCSRFRARFLGWYVCFAIRPCSIPLRSAIPNWRASKHTKRLADASLTRSARGPVSLRRILPAPRGGRQTSPAPGHRMPIVWPERRLLHYREPPGPAAVSTAPRAPGRSTISDPSIRGAGALEIGSLMDAKQVWRAVLGELQVSLSPANFETWLKDTALVEIDENRFRIAAPNGFARDWLDNRYRPLISQTLTRVVGGSVQMHFAVADAPAPLPTQDGDGELPLPPVSAGGNSVNLNSRYAFSHFIVGSADRLAHPAALSVAERPAPASHP